MTTGPVVVIDNVSGVLRSSTLAALLTASVWVDRKLGGMDTMISRPNDRLWIITGNNVTLGGDLPRRTLRVTIDPKTPQPELRTNFEINDLESWVRDHRGDLMAALLTIVRAWVVAGRPLGPERSSDGYARWVQSVEGILRVAGIEGGFDHVGTQVVVGHDDEEWADFLAAIHRHHGDEAWTCKELLDEVRQQRPHEPTGVTREDLPVEFTRPGSYGHIEVTISARSLGRWMMNRRGRWAGDFTVREAGVSQGTKRWRVEQHEVRQAAP